MFVSLAIVGAVVLGVTWVAYPAIVIAAARLVGRPTAAAPVLADAALPTVTCVLATRDEPAIIAERVADFLGQDYPAGRLTVVVGVDPTAPELRTALAAYGGPLADPRVRVVGGDDPGGKCPALNAAVRAATGEVLVFSDSRQRFEPQTTRRLATALAADAGLGTASGRLVLPRDEQSGLFRHYHQYEVALRSAEARLHSAVGVSGSVYAMRRALWTPLPGGLILDDLYVPMRLVLDGWRVGFVDDALAHETRKVAAGQEYRRKVRTLTGNYQLCAWLPAILVPIRNPIWAQFVCHKLFRLLTPWCALAIALGVVWVLGRAAGDRLPVALLAVAAIAGWVAVGRNGLARRLRNIVVQLVSLQAAVVAATVNGVRGRWDVWTR